MKILVIHDRLEVGSELQRIAEATAGSGAKVELVHDVFTARDKLKAGFYDLVAIDLTLPVKTGSVHVSLQNTQMLLDEIFNGDVNVPADVIGISREAEVLDLLRTTIGEHLMACLHEDTGGAWRQAFETKIRYLMNARSARRMVANSSHDVDLVIMTALDKEAQPYSHLFELAPSNEFHGAKVFSFQDAAGRTRKGHLYSIGQAGQPPCGSATQALLTQFRPKLIVMTGFCGGVAQRVGFGDLVAFGTTSAWDYGKWEQREDASGKRTVFRPRPMPLSCPTDGIREKVREMIASGFSPDPETLASVLKLSKGKITDWKLRLRGAGSGSAVVTSLETLDQIVDRDEEIWAIDMESYAFYYACLHTPVLSPDFICIKSVADHCNGDKNSDYHESCSQISAQFAKAIVTQKYNFGT